MKFDYLENKSSNAVQERAQMPVIYTFDSSKRSNRMQTPSKSTKDQNRDEKRSYLCREDDTKSLVLIEH